MDAIDFDLVLHNPQYVYLWVKDNSILSLINLQSNTRELRIVDIPTVDRRTVLVPDSEITVQLRSRKEPKRVDQLLSAKPLQHDSRRGYRHHDFVKSLIQAVRCCTRQRGVDEIDASNARIFLIVSYISAAAPNRKLSPA